MPYIVDGKEFETGNEKAAREEREETEKINNVKIGDGLTVSIYTDCHAGTVIKKTAKTIWIQQDEATLITKPNFVVGGFGGHCTNNRAMKYTYKADSTGRVYKVTKRKNGKWKSAGYKPHSIGGNVYVGRHEYYDYNF